MQIVWGADLARLLIAILDWCKISCSRSIQIKIHLYVTFIVSTIRLSKISFTIERITESCKISAKAIWASVLGHNVQKQSSFLFRFSLITSTSSRSHGWDGLAPDAEGGRKPQVPAGLQTGEILKDSDRVSVLSFVLHTLIVSVPTHIFYAVAPYHNRKDHDFFYPPSIFVAFRHIIKYRET